MTISNHILPLQSSGNFSAFKYLILFSLADHFSFTFKKKKSHCLCIQKGQTGILMNIKEALQKDRYILFNRAQQNKLQK